MLNLKSTPIDKIKQQEDFVKAIVYQKEVAINAYYDAKNYMEYITERYNTEREHLNKMKDTQ